MQDAEVDGRERISEVHGTVHGRGTNEQMTSRLRQIAVINSGFRLNPRVKQQQYYQLASLDPSHPPSVIIRLLMLLFACGTVLLLSLMPTPRVDDLHVLPRGLARFLDHQDFLRNMLGFGGLYLVCLWVFAGLMTTISPRQIAASVLLLACFLELAQLFIPARMADFMDVLAAAAGIAVVALAGKGLRRAVGKQSAGRKPPS